jgi:hypothetical protein
MARQVINLNIQEVKRNSRWRAHSVLLGDHY